MKTIDINIRIQFCQKDELQQEDQELIDCAIKATNNSYARYSNFHM